MIDTPVTRTVGSRVLDSSLRLDDVILLLRCWAGLTAMQETTKRARPEGSNSEESLQARACAARRQPLIQESELKTSNPMRKDTVLGRDLAEEEKRATIVVSMVHTAMKAHKEKKREKKSGVYRQILYPEDFRKKATFINVTIRDASEAVYGKVHSALGHLNVAPKVLPKLKGKVANKIAKAASKRVPPSKIANQLAEFLPKMLMYQMYHKNGMTISAQTMFIEDAYIVIQLQILKVDANHLLQDTVESNSDSDDGSSVSSSVSMKVVDGWLREQQEVLQHAEDKPATSSDPKERTSTAPSASNWYQSIFGYLPEETKSHIEAETLPQLVQSKLTERMQSLLLKQLESKQLTAEIAVLPEEEQARYFFPYLQQMRKRKVKSGKQQAGESDPVI